MHHVHHHIDLQLYCVYKEKLVFGLPDRGPPATRPPIATSQEPHKSTEVNEFALPMSICDLFFPLINPSLPGTQDHEVKLDESMIHSRYAAITFSCYLMTP